MVSEELKQIGEFARKDYLDIDEANCLIYLLIKWMHEQEWMHKQEILK